MHLRKLEPKDAPLMLEWMHEPSVVEDLHTDFGEKTLEDCIAFINESEGNDRIHLAIVDDSDEYLGTVSLKNIDSSSAEFAIIIRKCAMGKGISIYAMKEMLRIGLEEMKLNCIYWCVAPENKRAVRFYDKNGYARYTPDSEAMEKLGLYSISDIEHYIWYRVTATDTEHI